MQKAKGEGDALKSGEKLQMLQNSSGSSVDHKNFFNNQSCTGGSKHILNDQYLMRSTNQQIGLMSSSSGTDQIFSSINANPYQDCETMPLIQLTDDQRRNTQNPSPNTQSYFQSKKKSVIQIKKNSTPMLAQNKIKMESNEAGGG